uniref:Uncharacterized protein LOC110205599 isoform X1 n=1 Tax=Phascolarctos cinereus TaxID=38626 RepID=A0A6P5JY70_PHACI|nr:uncharacterized protein LOC110205599 isoform X1 [Phascolarctos cinereus]XP_020837950.1 uncharacterized protein LOC110205599 isoform X1 [Phascolarctos cinereus]XP_020837951.1 uncharacterized protein LOC110205599 isoform X1 [Phascolarctos cinereus]
MIGSNDGRCPRRNLSEAFLAPPTVRLMGPDQEPTELGACVARAVQAASAAQTAVGTDWGRGQRKASTRALLPGNSGGQPGGEIQPSGQGFPCLWTAVPLDCEALANTPAATFWLKNNYSDPVAPQPLSLQGDCQPLICSSRVCPKHPRSSPQGKVLSQRSGCGVNPTQKRPPAHTSRLKGRWVSEQSSVTQKSESGKVLGHQGALQAGRPDFPKHLKPR